MMEPATKARNVIVWSFQLGREPTTPRERRPPVELGARTLDILIELVSRPNEVVSKNDLLAQVWPDVTVEEGGLRFHIVSLRRALCDRKDGARYIATLKGRGCCFVASDRVEEIAVAARFSHANLPARLIGMFGREGGRRV